MPFVLVEIEDIPIFLTIDALGIPEGKVLDIQVRVKTLRDSVLRFPTGVPGVVNVVPFDPDDDLKREVKTSGG